MALRCFASLCSHGQDLEEGTGVLRADAWHRIVNVAGAQQLGHGRAKCSVFGLEIPAATRRFCVTDALIRDLNRLKILAESVNIIDKASPTDALILDQSENCSNFSRKVSVKGTGILRQNHTYQLYDKMVIRRDGRLTGRECNVCGQEIDERDDDSFVCLFEAKGTVCQADICVKKECRQDEEAKAAAATGRSQGRRQEAEAGEAVKLGPCEV